MKKIKLALIAMVGIFCFACEEKEVAKEVKNVVQETAELQKQSANFTDSRDGKKYKIVKIGEQVWMAENLNYEANGSKCYDNKTENCEKYGKLYNWETAMKACPSGWHLPNNAEWDKLYRFADGSSGSESPYNSITAGKYLKAKNDWKEPSNGTNTHGFTALPGGYGDPYNAFRDIYVYSYWWSSNENNANNAYARYMFNLYEGAYWVENFSKKNLLLSVRCLQD